MPFHGVAGADLLARALEALIAEGLKVRARSSVWRSEAWPPGGAQPDYFNAVAEIDAAGFAPADLYAVLRAVEARFGRERRARWASRTLDLDIVAMAGLCGDYGGIQLPHPRMHERAFVLAPMAEIAPDWRHPAFGATVAELLAALPPGDSYERVGALGGPAG